MKAYLTEFIGTFFLVLTIGLSVVGETTFAPVAIGCVLMVMVYMGGHISGAHYNPAVTLAILMRGKIDTAEAFKYMAVQVAGSLVAALIVGAVMGDTLKVAPGLDFNAGAAVLNEVLFTFALALVVLNVATADDTKGNDYYGLAIGFTVLAGAVAGGGISGGAYNPAVGVGAILADALMGEGTTLSGIWIYLLGPFAGGALAAVVFRMQNGV